MQDERLSRRKGQELTFAVVRGNNNEGIVQEVMGRRKGWREAEAEAGEVPNFKWVFSKNRLNYKKVCSYNKKIMVNHFECN